MILEEARRVVQCEMEALKSLKDRLDHTFERAVEMITQCEGKVVFSGVGKSGIIARKIASTMASTGTPAIFIHPVEAAHGDLGVLTGKDCLGLISYGGETTELRPLIEHAKRNNIPVFAMTGETESMVARLSDLTLDISVEKEACPLGLAPTSSTTVSLVLGDALALVVLKEKGFQQEDFALNHPGGTLGRRLFTRVKDLMHKSQNLVLVRPHESMREVIALMTRSEVRGVAGILNDQKELIGVITDGDIRRRLEKSLNPLDETAQDLMSQRPKIIDAEELAQKALFLMEEFRIQNLFVVDKKNSNQMQPVGLLHFQDLLKAGLK